jgi:hypothetical protein
MSSGWDVIIVKATDQGINVTIGGSYTGHIKSFIIRNFRPAMGQPVAIAKMHSQYFQLILM